jgi:hypothetical protein
LATASAKTALSWCIASASWTPKPSSVSRCLGPRKFAFRRQHLSKRDRNSLVSFWEGLQGEWQGNSSLSETKRDSETAVTQPFNTTGSLGRLTLECLSILGISGSIAPMSIDFMYFYCIIQATYNQ